FARLPADEDAVSAIIVVRLEHEVVARGANEFEQVYLSPGVRRAPGFDAPRPGNMPSDGLALGFSEAVLVALVCEHAEEHLLVNVLGAERVDEDGSLLFVRINEVAALVFLFEQLGGQHAPVNQVDAKVFVIETAFAQANIARVGNRCAVAVLLEIRFEHLELALRRQAFVVDDADLWAL